MKKVLDLINRYGVKIINDIKDYTYIFNNKKLDYSLTVAKTG